MDIKKNSAAQNELIKEILSLQQTYGINNHDFGIILLAIGCDMIKNAGGTKSNICEMINRGLK